MELSSRAGATLADGQRKPVGGLVYVVGASGAGKDALLGWCRERIRADDPVAFAHRYISRPPDPSGENHVALTRTELAARLDARVFAMCWEANGLTYAVGREVDLWLEAGLTVVVNGSRAYVPRVRGEFARLCVVWITARQDVIRRRLAARARESSSELANRIQRGRVLDEDVSGADVVIANDGALERAGERLLAVIRSAR